MIVYVRNNKYGLEFLNKIMKLFPEYKKENVVDVLRQGYDIQLVEVP